MDAETPKRPETLCLLPKGGRVAVEGEKGAECACRALMKRLTQRGLRAADSGAELAIDLVLTEGAPEDEGAFRITSRCGETEKRITITASSRAALFFGAGELLRRIRWHRDGSAEVPCLDMEDRPRMPWRAVMTCYHNQDNGYKYWDIERERDFMEEMALWGSNMAMFSPLNMWQRDSATLTDGTPENANWNTMSSMPAVADEMGLKYGMLNVPNDVFRDDLDHCRRSQAGPGQMLFAECACACPSDPRAWDIILQRREEFFSRLKRVDFLYIHPSDYGGCSCDECGPYIPTYLRLAKAVAGVMRKYHPAAKVYIGTVLITEEGMRRYVLPYLRSPESDWLDGIVYGMHGTAVSLTELSRSAKAGNKELVLYPEITMIENWGRLGAAPWVRHFAYSLEKTQDMASECNRLGRWPNTSERMFGESFPVSFDPDTMSGLISGAFVYSEGLHDDVAKILWLRYCWDPDMPREEMLREYCRCYFGEEACGKACEAILLMEEISYNRDHKLFCPPLTYNDDGTGLEKSRRVFELLTEMKSLMPDWARDSWRFRFPELRSHIDLAAFKGPDATEADREEILDLAEAIYRETLHVNILPAGSPWNREKAAASLGNLLKVPENIQAAAPVSPTAEF